MMKRKLATILIMVLIITLMIPAAATPRVMTGRAVSRRRSSIAATRAPVQAPVPGRGTATSKNRPSSRVTGGI